MARYERANGGMYTDPGVTFTPRQAAEHVQRGAYFSNLASVSSAQASLQALLEAVEGNLENITYQNGRRLYMMIQQRVPYRSGRLAASVRVDRIRGVGGRVTGFRAYAFAVNPDTGEEYAVEQHENTSYHHAPGRTHHYISIPFEQVINLMDHELRDNAEWITKQMYMDNTGRNRIWRQDPNPEAFASYFKNLQNIPHRRGSVNFGGGETNWSQINKHIGRNTKYKKGSKRSGYYRR